MSAAFITDESWVAFWGGSNRENRAFWDSLESLCDAVAWKMTTGKVPGKEILSAVAVALLEAKPDDLVRLSAPKSYCFGVVRHCVLAALRVERKYQKQTVSSVNDEGEDWVGLDTDAAVAVSEKEKVAEGLADLLQRANLNKQEDAVAMLKLEGFNQEEIAEILEISPARISQIWSKATGKIRAAEQAKELERVIREDTIAIIRPPDDVS